MWDAVVIGGGVIGCAVARELSRYAGKVCLVERNEDVCTGTSKANSAIVHAGFDAMPGTKKSEKGLVDALKAMLGIYAQVHLVSPKSIARSEGKDRKSVV